MAEIMVTGGKGFIGTNLVNILRERGHDVYTIDMVHHEDPKHYRCDVREYRQLENIFRNHKFEFVYHLAAEYGRHNGEAMYENLWETNVIGTKNILRLQEVLGFRHVFYSSAEVYGDYDEVMDEEVMDRVPIKQMNDYAITKWAGEMMCINSANEFGTETVRVRPVNAYGPHDIFSRFRGVIPVMVYSALTDTPYTVYKGHYRIFDYIDDTARTMANISDNFLAGEAYNIGGKEDWIVDIKTLSDMVLGLLGKDDSQVTYVEAEPHTTKIKKMDFSKSRRDLGHDPACPLDVGLPKYIEWVRSHYGL